MSDKATSGPWMVATADGYNANHVYAPDGKNAVAQVYGITSHSSLEDVSQDPRWAEGLANARLISAAPEMLEALEWALVSLEFDGLENTQAGKRVRAAISKAKGQ